MLTSRATLTGNKHPIVFLKDIRPKHLEQLLQYMYNGEINVLQVRDVDQTCLVDGGTYLCLFPRQ